jgi:ELWxxDGT repeat protein
MSSPGWAVERLLLISRSHVFLSFTDSANGSELWRSDGTAAGTVLVKGIFPELNSSLTDLTNVDGTLYFVANDDFDGKQLWKSDGTAAGTTMVKAINPSGSSDTSDLTNVDGTLYFAANDGVHGEELWKSNGTAAGTVMVKDLDTGNTAGSRTLGPDERQRHALLRRRHRPRDRRRAV